jgi:hypothetical protein
LSSSSQSDDKNSQEWDAARDVLNNFDERLHDLRKYGFSFITGLLSVDAIFAGPSTIPLSWKLAALIATLCLIVSLNLVDRNYRVIQLAATIDAQFLERRSDVNLTQTISRIYNDAHVKFFFQTVYIMFTLAALLLGWFILADSSYYLLLLVAFGVAMYGLAWCTLYPRQDRSSRWLGTFALGFISVCAILATIYYTPNDITKIKSGFYPHITFGLHYHLTLLVMVAVAIVCIVIMENAVDIRPWVNLVIDAYEYEQGERVLVTISNVGREDLHLQRGVHVLTVHRENDTTMKKPRKISGLGVPEGIKLLGGKKHDWQLSWADHRWQFSTKDLRPGLYRVVYRGPIYSDVPYITHIGFTRRKLVYPTKKRQKPVKFDPRKVVPYIIDSIRRKLVPTKGTEKDDPWKVAQRFSVTERIRSKRI